MNRDRFTPIAAYQDLERLAAQVELPVEVVAEMVVLE